MSAWRNLLRNLGIIKDKKLRSFDLDTTLQDKLIILAEERHRSPGEIQAEVIEVGLSKIDRDSEWIDRWDKLSPREQQVAALTCLGYTNKQIAAKLLVSPETVKSHIKNILYKFNLHSKAQIMQALAGWDFSLFGRSREE